MPRKTSYLTVHCLTHTHSPEEVIEYAYLACRNITNKISSALLDADIATRIDRMFKDHHLGLLEHANATFVVSGVSRSLTHQLVRHRLASYAQLSMRHVEPNMLHTITPPSIESHVDARLLFRQTVEATRKAYEGLREYGIPKEDARFIIPMGIETNIVISMNFRAWIHFLKLRTHKKAQWEIRALANEIWGQLKKIAPHVFDEKYKEFWE